jgi:hypothetical protein
MMKKEEIKFLKNKKNNINLKTNNWFKSQNTKISFKKW